MPTPTIAEVEARLRATATACEPLVEDLLDEDPPLTVAPAGRERRSRALLLAAAVIVLVAVAAGVVVASRDDGTAEVAVGDGTVPAPPGEGVLLPDGTRVPITVPGPEDWRPAGGSASFTADGWAEARSLRLEPGTIADLPGDPEVVRTYGAGRTLVRDRLTTEVVVERHGWVGSVMVATTHDEDEDLPSDVIDVLARDLTFSVTPEGPVAVGGPGLRPVSASRYLRPATGGDDEIAVVRQGGRPVESCTQPVIPPLWVCSADDTVLVMVMTEAAEGERLAPRIRVASPVEGTASTTGPATTTTRTTAPTGPIVEVPVGLADGTQVVLDIPGDETWTSRFAILALRVDGVGEPSGIHQVTALPVDAATVAARDGATLEPLADGRALATDPSGRRSLLVEDGGWTVAIPLDEGGWPVPEPVQARLEASIELVADSAGPRSLTADGLEVVWTTTAVASSAAALPGHPDGMVEDTLRFTVEPGGCGDGAGRCLDGGVGVVATGPTAEAALAALTADVVRPPR